MINYQDTDGSVKEATGPALAKILRAMAGISPTATDAELAAAQVAQSSKAKIASIDTKTGIKISQGYTYADKIFSASSNHQTWALGILTGISAGIDYTGIKVSTIDNQNFHTIVDNNDAAELAKACINHVKNWLSSGSQLKDQIINATTIEEINAIADNR